MPQGVKTAGSPTAEDVETELDGGQATDNALESSTSNDETSSESSTEDSAGSGETSTAKKTTPLDALRGKLTSGDEPEVADDTDDEAEAESEDAETEESDDRKPNVKTKPEKTESATDGDEPEDPFHGIKPEDRNRLGRVAQARIRELHAAKQALDKQTKENAPIINAGRFLEKVRTDSGLTEQEVIDSLALSAAFNAGDPRALKALEDHADTLRKHLKKPPRSGAGSIKPFTGSLPTEYADMVSVLGMDESRVRFLYAADKAHQEAEANHSQEEHEEEDPPARPLRQRQPTQPRTSGGFHPSDVASADDAAADFLVSKGIKSDPTALKAHMAKLYPYLDKHAPVNPATGKPDRRLIDPERRLKAVEIAHQRFVLSEAKRIAEEKRTAGTQRTGSTTTVAQGRTGSGKTATPLEMLRRQKVGR